MEPKRQRHGRSLPRSPTGPPGDDNEEEGRKKKKQIGLGAFGFKRQIEIVHKGQIETVQLPVEVEDTVTGPTAANMTHGCEGCGQYFKTAQGLGSHRNSCSVVQYQRQQQVQQHGMVLSALGAPAAPPGSSTLDGSPLNNNIQQVAILLGNYESKEDESKEANDEEEHKEADEDGWEDVEDEEEKSEEDVADR